ncbi:hypothetical protein BH11VER1_BH11VER1_24170 [soil metagenome]
MKKTLLSCLATLGLLALSNCESMDNDHDRDHRHHGGTTTTTTEETTISTPLSTTVETQTVRSY